MKLHILSDLHLEFDRPFDADYNDANVVVLAGDIDLHTRGLVWASREPAFDGKTVIYVPGNHEYYGSELVEMRAEMYRKAEALRAEGHRIFVLDCDAIEIDCVRVLGATCWTDYRLFGEGLKDIAMLDAKRMNDHRLISFSDGRGQLDSYTKRSSLFLPQHAERLHQHARAWLTDQLAQPFDGKTVVITHHLPSWRSVATRFERDTLTPAFASNLDHLVEQADLWIHGHTHDAFDYQLGRCRVVCNPMGYPGERGTGFRPDLVMEI
jgi:predicted phosphodiesterase